VQVTWDVLSLLGFGLVMVLTSRSSGSQLHGLVGRKGERAESYQRVMLVTGLLMAVLGLLGLAGLIRFGDAGPG